MIVIRFELPLRLPSLKNVREHRAVRARRTAEQRGVTRMRLRAAMGSTGYRVLHRVVITIIRIDRVR